MGSSLEVADAAGLVWERVSAMAFAAGFGDVVWALVWALVWATPAAGRSEQQSSAGMAEVRTESAFRKT